MAVDEVLWRGVQKGACPPTIRFFAWDPPALSLGYGQSVMRDIDVDALERLGIPMVRRPTGGRAVLHDVELTYSVVFPEDPWEPADVVPRNPGGNSAVSLAGLPHAPILRDYAAISLGLAAGLRNLGVDATLAPSTYRVDPRDRSGACFSSTSAFEVMAAGKKIVGSAQRRGGGAVLQHGSIPLDLDIDKLCALFKLSSDEARARLAANLRKKTISVREALGGRIVSYDEARDAFEAGFCDVAGDTAAGSLTQEEMEAASELARVKKAEFEAVQPGRLNAP